MARARVVPLLKLTFGVVALGAVAVVGSGFALDFPQPPPPPSDAIVVISGDEQLARFREGLRLYRDGMGKYLVFSGAAQDGGASNADVMRQLALEAGIPSSAIVDEPQAEDTWGNAIYTRPILEKRGARRIILVTSPYHVERAKLTFEAAYAGSGIQIVAHAAPDSEWRKLSWWEQPDTRRLTLSELEKLGYIFATGKYN